jgi:hypothetical protein
LTTERDISLEADGGVHSHDWVVTTEGVSNIPNVHDQLQAFLVSDSWDNSDVMEDDSTVIMPQPLAAIPPETELAAPTSRKRRGKEKTHVVDDEVRRCPRFKKVQTQMHFQLNSEPRR